MTWNPIIDSPCAWHRAAHERRWWASSGASASMISVARSLADTWLTVISIIMVTETILSNAMVVCAYHIPPQPIPTWMASG